MNQYIKLCEYVDANPYIDRVLINLIIENFLKIHQKLDTYQDLSDAIGIKIEFSDFSNSKLPIEKLASLILYCRLKNDQFPFFYSLGYNQNKVHHQILGYLVDYLMQTQRQIKYLPYELTSTYLNLITILVSLENNRFDCYIELHPDVKQKYNNIQKPLLYIIYGFVSKILEITFGWQSDQLKISFNKKYENLGLADLHISVGSLPEKNRIFKVVDLKGVLLAKVAKLKEIQQHQSIEDKTKAFLNRDICFTVEEIATLMNISPRSLQRKLKTHGTSFSKIKEEMRKELVMSYLKDENISIPEISDLLGYSERSAFERAFKKWFDLNPREWKKKVMFN